MKLLKDYKSFLESFIPVMLIAVLFSSCASPKRYSGFTFVRNYQKDTPFIFKNNIRLMAEKASKDELAIMKLRIGTQLTDSARLRVKDAAFILHYIKNPPIFDTIAIQKSADNVAAYMHSLGYYHPAVNLSYDTVSKKRREQQRIIVNYDVVSGKRTVVDTLAYLFNQPELQEIATSTKKQSTLQKGQPVTQEKILAETNRLVNEFRNFGYYKFTADELRATGDTTIAALTTVSEDPFEQLQILAEAAEKRNNPTIRLGFQLNDPSTADSLKKYYVNDIYILPDYSPSVSYTNPMLHEEKSGGYNIRFRDDKFKTKLFDNKIYLHNGDVFSQRNYDKTISELYKFGVWESPTIDITELPDTNTVDLVVKLIPLRKYAFQGNIELSYSANSSTSNLPQVSTGNLFGVSVNLSLTDRNFARSAIRMTNAIKIGAEFNTNKRNSGGTFINSREVSFNNSFVFPKFIFPFARLNSPDWNTHQTFVNNNISFINRIDFYNQQIINTSYGFNFSRAKNRLWSLKLINFDFRRLYNRSEVFDHTLLEFPNLRYSFNTALVLGSSVAYSSARTGFRHPNIINRLLVNVEESGLLWGLLKEQNKPAGTGNFFNKFLREFVKADIEYVSTINIGKSAVALRAFAGVGIPVSKSDTTLPFFKQYFGGGPNSMRAWPVQGIGIGGQSLAPYIANGIRFNDRTGDIQIEGNIEYRFDVAPLFSNAAMFKMALFADVGNIWNFKNTRPDHQIDTTQFKFANIYKQLGVSSGVGFRFDFNYFLVRLDMAMRFKRPDLWTDHAGWQFPAVSFSNLFGSSLKHRIWRYENFNATIGIDYPF